MKTYGERLRWGMARKKMGPTELAAAVGIKQPSINHLLTPKAKKSGHTHKIATVLGLSPEWLAYGRGSSLADDDEHIGNLPDHLPAVVSPLTAGITEIAGTEFAAIGCYDAALSAGPGSLLIPDPEPLRYHLVEASWLAGITRAKPEDLALLRVDGDSMERTLLHGDWVLIDRTQRRITRQGIYALQVGEDAWIKRLMLDLGTKKVKIISDNAAYPVQELAEDDITLLGRFLALCWRTTH